MGSAVLVVLGVTLTACGGGRATPGIDDGSRGLSECAAANRPDRCLGRVEQAAQVTSLRLTASIPNQVKTSCQAAAQRTALTVVCPPVVPAGGVVSDPQLYGPVIVNRQSYSISINNGQNPGRVHWEIGATRGPAAGLWIFDRASWDATPPKRPAVRIGAQRYFGHLVTLWRFPDSDGQLEGHDAAFATLRAVTYFVSIHGHNHDDADIAMLLGILGQAM